MPLTLTNLDDRTRKLMIAEVDSDIASGKLYISPRLTPAGAQQYPSLLKQAILNGDYISLARNLRLGALIRTKEERRKPKGGVTVAKVPVNAPDILAEGEFNRFYCRAVCARAIEDGIAEVVVYRAKHVDNPRPESEAKLGASINAKALLRDLQTHPGVDTALGIPAGPNSGLSVKLP